MGVHINHKLGDCAIYSEATTWETKQPETNGCFPNHLFQVVWVSRYTYIYIYRGLKLGSRTGIEICSRSLVQAPQERGEAVKEAMLLRPRCRTHRNWMDGRHGTEFGPFHDWPDLQI